MIRMRSLFAALLLTLLVVYAASSCQREDGLPDPPLRTLVPCNPDAGEDDPLACPALPAVDMGSEDLLPSDDL